MGDGSPPGQHPAIVRDVLATTTISNADCAKYETVLKTFDGFFQVRLNVIFERACFNRHNQLIGEAAEQYITTLYGLIESCNYGGLRDELLRDRLVVSIADQALSERLHLKTDLTLDDAKKIIQQKEAVHDQHQQLWSSGDGTKKNPIELDRLGHVGAQCLSKTLGEATQELETVFLEQLPRQASPPGKRQCRC